MIALPERGRLEETPLPGLLLGLQRARFDGSLDLTRERARKRFLIHRGVPVYAESNLASESLAVQLMDAGVITRAEHSRVVEFARRHDCREGHALLELQLIDPKGLFLALKEQLRVRLMECFAWVHGRYALDASAPPPADAQAFRSDLYALLQEGVEAHWSAERMIAALADRMNRYPTASEPFARVVSRLRRDDATDALLARLDGSHTLWHCLQEAGTPRALATAWLLDAAGALRYGSAPKSDADARDAEPEAVVEIEFADPDEARAAPFRRVRAERAPRRDAGSERADALRREIDDKHARLDDLDLYAVLGVERDAEGDAVKAAYLSAAKSYHPDALARARLDDETRARATRVFARISKAYAILSNPTRRSEYDATLGGDEAALDANRVATAENLYRKGEILLRQGNFRGALEFFKPCVDLWPDECAYRSALGWTLYKKMPSEPEAAREQLEAAARLDPGDGMAQFRLGVVLRALGDEEGAAQAEARASLAERGVS